MDGELRAKQHKAESNFQIPLLLHCHLSHTLNVFCFLGTNKFSHDLQQARAHEYNSTALQMLPVKTIFRSTPLNVLGLLVFSRSALSSRRSVPGRANEQVQVLIISVGV